MGPRLVSRGNPHPACRSALNCAPLQWGRDSLVAEMGQLAEALLKAVTLQWGRDSLVAEITPPIIVFDVTCEGFNGAATR